MAVFEIQGPDGKTFEIDAPDAGAAQKAWQGMMQPSTGKDIAMSGGVGVAKGGIGLLGLPGDIAEYGARGIDRASRFVGGMLGVDVPKREDRAPTYGSADIQKTVESVTGDFYKPKTTAGQFAQTVGEFAPGALLGGGGAVRNLANYALVPGIVSEAAGRLPGVQGTAAEPWVKAGTGLAAGGLAGAVNRPSTVNNVVGNATRGVTPQQADAAEQLFMQALQAGTPITRAEALQHVTGGGTYLADIQRLAEGSGAMRPFMAQRAGQVEHAGRQMIDTVAPPTPTPSMIGPQVGEAAETTLNDVRGAINRATRPSYDAAGQTLVPQAVHAQRMSDPLFVEALNTIRNDAARNAPVRGQSDRSVAVYDAVMKELRERSTRASNPVQPGHSQQVSTYTGRLSDDVRGDSIAATGGPGGAYDTALTQQAQLRQQYLEPLQRGPLGKIAGEPTTQNAIEALFPRNPLPNSADEIHTAVQALAHRNTPAARQLVAAHIESVFNQATRDLRAGPNQWGGAGFAAALRGNGQQAANLEAAVRALPGGDQTWQGIDRFLTIMEAQGARHAPGAQTAYNQEIQSQLRRGGPIGEAVTMAAGAGLSWPARARDAFQTWTMGANVDQLAHLFTNPQAGRLFREMVGANTRRSEIIAMKLSLMGANQATAKERN
jgi:hypothetical protein